MTLHFIFFDASNRLRSGWRFSIFILAFAVVGTVAGLTAIGVVMILSETGEPASAASIVVSSLASLIVALLAGWFCGRYLEGLPFRALGASPSAAWLKNFGFGLLIGGSTFAIAALIGMTGGGLSFKLNTDAGLSAILTTMALSFGIFAAAAAFEEAFFRGYILQTFIRSDLTMFAALFTSAIFATVHNANPNATRLSWLNTFLAGIWFAAAYLKTRDLWLVFGLHLAWNWVQGAIFGVEVSGLTEIVKAPIMREFDAGPAWLTGGDYGLEGGVACTVALIASTIAVYFLPFLRPSDEMLALTSPPPTLSSADL